MRTTRIALLTGAAAILLAGYASLAEARTPQSHVLTLRLPDGQVEQIRYAGDVPPVVIVAPETEATAFYQTSPFAMLNQIEAAMDRQAEAMFQNINTLMVQTAGAFGSVPAMFGPGVCMRSVEISYSGNGQAPHVVSRSSGDCGPGNAEATPAARPTVPMPNRTPHIIEAKAANPYAGLVHRVGDWQR